MKVLIITGEISGDLYASLLVKRIREINPALHFIGIGGPKLRGTDTEILFSAESLSLIGLPKPSDLKKYYFIYKKIEDLLRKRKVDLVILVDFPGFNLKIAKLAKSLNYPVIYYVAPQVWAWHKKRIKILKKCVDLLLVILPFEEEFFKSYGLPVKYLGHPAVDVVKVNLSKDLFYEMYGIKNRGPIISFFPGSREGEVTRHLPLFLKVYNELKKKNPEIFGIIGKAPGLKETTLWENAKKEMLVLENMSYEILKYSHASLLASGTITLEAALLETPAVVTYSLPPWIYFIAKRLVKVPFISLPNLILGREVYPEILQDKSSPLELASALERVINRETEIKNALKEIKTLLGSPGVTWKIAEEINKFVHNLKYHRP
ncbi:MAG: lipid-A-disaccharide synthase [Caldimicrobium sp.]